MEHGGRSADYEPNFTLPQFDAVREDNWAKYDAGGFGVVWASPTEPGLIEALWETAKAEFGAGNVYRGDAYDEEAKRPLRHKPGVGIYVSPEGLKYREERRTARQSGSDQVPSENDPAAS